MNEITHAVWAILVALPWLLILGFTLVHVHSLSRMSSGLLVFGTVLQLLSHGTGILRYHRLQRGEPSPELIHALVSAESVIWIVGGLLFAAGFWMLIKTKRGAQSSHPD